MVKPGCLILFGAAVLLTPVSPFVLPAPTGTFAVGTTSWVVTDPVRRETFTGGAQRRRIKVVAWYPARARSTDIAPYLREGVAEARVFAALFKQPDAFDSLGSVATHGMIDAVPRSTGGRFPVLLFSHGYTGIPSSYTALLEDLASHGYAVFSIIHPYEATAVTLGDGALPMVDGNGAFLPPTQEVFAEWSSEDDTMAAVTKAATEAEQLKLLRGYIGSIPKTHVVLRRWVDDTRLVLNQLAAGARGGNDATGQLRARLDLVRVGVFGHSMGGVAAGQFCLEDRRCKAGLNLDGSPQSGTMIDLAPGKQMAAPFLMVYSARPGRAGANDAIYRRGTAKYIRVDVEGTRHLDFSDMTLWGGPLRARPILGTIAPDRVIELTRTIVREYFDQILLGRRSPLLAGASKVAEVVIR